MQLRQAGTAMITGAHTGLEVKEGCTPPRGGSVTHRVRRRRVTSSVLCPLQV